MYLCHAVGDPDNRVAIKVPRASAIGEDMDSIFKNSSEEELKAMSGLNHENLIRLLDHG